MPIVEGKTCSFSRNGYVTDAILHEEGILWVESGAKVTYTFEWHEYIEQPVGIPWPFPEIRKDLVDNMRGAHSCSSFVHGCEVFSSFNGRAVYSHKTFLERFDDTNVKPLTEVAQVYCDSREMIHFEYHEGSWIEPGRFMAHFDKHSGGYIRLLFAEPWIFMETRTAFFDDRASGELLELEEPTVADTNLDLWRNIYLTHTTEEYRAWHSTGLVKPTFSAPPIFVHSDATGDPDPNVKLLAEPWNPNISHREEG